MPRDGPSRLPASTTARATGMIRVAQRERPEDVAPHARPRPPPAHKPGLFRSSRGIAPISCAQSPHPHPASEISRAARAGHALFYWRPPRRPPHSSSSSSALSSFSRLRMAALICCASFGDKSSCAAPNARSKARANVGGASPCVRPRAIGACAIGGVAHGGIWGLPRA